MARSKERELDPGPEKLPARISAPEKQIKFKKKPEDTKMNANSKREKFGATKAFSDLFFFFFAVIVVSGVSGADTDTV